MSETKNLKLFKHEEPLETNNNKFDIDKALNKNWDKVDDYAGEANSKIDLITEIIDLLPKVSDEGESIALENTARAKFTKFRIEGNSKQETRSGKNLINLFSKRSAGYSTTVNGVTFTLLEDGKIRVNGTATGGRAAFTFTIPDTIVKAGNYILSQGSEKVQVEAKIGDTYYRVAGSSTNVSIAEAQKIFYVALIINEGLTVNNEVVYAQLEDGTVATEYEQYGTMPSEEFPSEIRNVGDNGNLYDKDNPNILDTPIDTSGLGGNVKNAYKTVWIPCKPNTTYTVSKKYDATKNRFALAYTSEEPNYSQQVEGYVSNAYTNVMTITTNSTAKYLIAYVWITGGSNTYQEMLDSIKIERGVQATADSGYGCGNLEIIISNENLGNNESHIVFPFVQGQKLMQGDYLADDGIHHKRKQVVLDGSDDEGWGYNSGSLSNNISAFTANISNLISVENTDTKVRVMCNKTIGLSASEATKLQKYNAIAVIQDKRIYLCVQRSSFSTSPSTLKTWLQSNPITVEYELAEEEIETYTEVQKEAYEQIKNAISYKGQTNIFSTNEIKPIFKVEALADIGLLLNNMQAQILAGGE
jgi:hypothetical protein